MFSTMAHLLLPRVPREKRHPTFTDLLSARWLRSGRLLLQDTYARLAAREHDFINRFQGEEFDRRTFELFVSEVLYEAGASFAVNGEHPDFEPTINGVSFALECATANQTSLGGQPKPYNALNPADGDIKSLRDRLLNEVPTRFSGVLDAKQKKRFKPGNYAYWELPHVVGKPFVYAVQTFHEDGALGFSGSAVTTYLYGLQHTPTFEEDGKLIIRQNSVTAHNKPNGQSIPSGFFNDPANAHVSAVLWSNSGTIPKFARMALEGPYPDEEVVAFRVGVEADPDPNAHAPLPFAYQVGMKGAHPESWGEGSILFHNPLAVCPLPRDLLGNVCNAFIDDNGRYVETFGARLAHPFSSHTYGGHGRRQIAAAEMIARRHHEILIDMVEEMKRTRSKDWWSGFEQGGDDKSYRSDVYVGDGKGGEASHSGESM